VSDLKNGYFTLTSPGRRSAMLIRPSWVGGLPARWITAAEELATSVARRMLSDPGEPLLLDYAYG
jgi:hypothetical protein